MSRILVIDDDPLIRLACQRILRNAETEILTAETAEEGIGLLDEHKPDVILLDVLLPDLSGLETFERIRAHDGQVPVIFITAASAGDIAIEAMKLGAFDYLIKPLDFAQVRELIGRALEVRQRLWAPIELVTGPGTAAVDRDCLIGRCEAMQKVYKAIGLVAPKDVTVLIRGESGTGKELIARAIYQHSRRAEGRFLAVNCAAIPETLLESELFGHEKGAFTGANYQRVGKFEQCSGGTLFLDEIGDMSAVMQSKILRFLQEQCFERVGGSETIQTDVRIIAATNRDLESMIRDGQFRADLYYRLSVFEIRLPPLRERPGDLPLLLEHFVRRFGKELGKEVDGVSLEALEALHRYSWPGNVRELQSVVKQALLRATGPVIVPAYLPESVRQASHAVSPPAGPPSPHTPIRTADEPPSPTVSPDGSTDWDRFIDQRVEEGTDSLYAECLAEMERRLLTRVLERTGGNQAQAARILGITRGSLRKKIRAHGLRVASTVLQDSGNGSESPVRATGKTRLGG